jgi:Ca2+-binding RTX toxin-like protein
VTLSGVSTGAGGVITVTATNTSGSDLATNAALLSFSIATTADVVVEANETFTVSLGSSTAAVATGTVTTTITDNDAAAITLSGPATVAEGATTTPYTVSLIGVGLGVGQSVTFTLDTASGSATEGIDFAALVEGSLDAAAGVTLSGVSTGAGGVITVTATNTSGSDLATNAALLSFSIATTADVVVEANETFTVSLGSSTAAVTTGTVTTTITDVNPLRNEGAIITAALNAQEWSLLGGDTRTFGGIASLSADRQFTVSTGNGDSRVFLTDAIAYATLNAGNGDNDISILVEPGRDDIQSYVQFGHGAYFASIIAGDGNDVVNIQSADNVAFVRDNPQSPPGYELSDYYQSIVDVGAGNDYVYAFLPFQSQFFGGDGVDTIFFYGRFSDWSYEVVDATRSGSLDITLSDNAQDYSVWTVGENISSTARNNRVQGFELIQFNDILLKVREAIAISGPANVDEGSAAVYAISLAGDGLRAQESVTFDLQVASLGATAGLDYEALTEERISSLLRSASTGVSLDVISLDPVFQVVRAVVTANRDLATGSVIANFSVPTLTDSLLEDAERFSVTLSGFIDPVTVVTEINEAPAIALSGPGIVEEGSTTTPYVVSLSGVPLAAGQRLTFTLDTSTGPAIAGVDFRALTADDLRAGRGVTLSQVRTNRDGTLTVTAQNTSGSELLGDARLIRFRIATIDDNIVQSDAEPLRAPTSSAPVSDGVYKVGVDIEPGVYRGELTASAGDFAFWQISSDPNGADIISNALPTGPFFVSVEQDQFLEIRRARLSFFEPLPSGVAGSSLSRQLTVSIASQDANVTASSVGTVIDDNDVAILALSGPSSVREGRTTRPYTVSLGDVALADGVEVPLEIRLRSLSATLGEDFRPLSSQSVTAASGVTLSGFEPSTDGTLKLRLTNSSGSLIEAGSRLLRFSVDTIPDNLVEGDERFRVALASESANILKGSKSVRTTIRDSVVSAEDGGSNVFVLAEGVRRPRVVRGTNRADVITGNEFNNVLYGRKGADLLTGGGGQDVFQFRLRDGLDQGDVITDFTPRNDRIQLRDVPKNSLAASLYNGKKTLSASNVNRAFEQILDPSRAERSSAVFVYSSLTGDLFYNANGSARGFGADGGVIATLPVLLDFNARDVILSYSS